ncbi:MAG: penicillin-binding protein activator LpoB [Parvibaculales bacterium]
MKSLKLAIILSAALVVSACQGSTAVRVNSVIDNQPETQALNARDFQEAAVEMVESMISSGSLNNPNGGRYILAISNIDNRTMQRIDTDQLVKKIRVSLLNSGRVLVTTAVGIGGAEDKMSRAARELREDDEFDQSRVARKSQLQAPEFSLSGKIIQKDVTVNRSKRLVEYYFQLSLTHIESGLAYWEGEKQISKMGSSKTVSW